MERKLQNPQSTNRSIPHVDRVVSTWWLQIPSWLLRFSPTLATAWADGLYLTAWPVAALLLPFLTLLFGVYEGATHWCFNYAFDNNGHFDAGPAVAFIQIPFLLFAAATLGALSAQLGLLLVIGYALGDWFLAKPASNPGLWIVARFLEIGIPKLIIYLLFFMLAVLPTLVGQRLWPSAPLPTNWSKAARAQAAWAIVIILQGVMVFTWTYAAPMVVRPAWNWPNGGQPPVDVLSFVEVFNPWLPIVAMTATLGRALLSRLPAQQSNRWKTAGILAEEAAEQKRSAGLAQYLPSWLAAVLTAFVVTLLLAGFFNNFTHGAETFVLIATIFLARNTLLPEIFAWAAWTRRISSVPVVYRWLGVILGAYLIQKMVFLVTGFSARDEGAVDFAGELIGIVSGLVLVVILMPLEEDPGAPRILKRFDQGAKAKWTAGPLLLTGVSLRPSFAFASCLAPGCCFQGFDITAIHSVVAFVILSASLLLLGRKGRAPRLHETPISGDPVPPRIEVEDRILEGSLSAEDAEKEPIPRV